MLINSLGVYYKHKQHIRGDTNACPIQVRCSHDRKAVITDIHIRSATGDSYRADWNGKAWIILDSGSGHMWPYRGTTWLSIAVITGKYRNKITAVG